MLSVHLIPKKSELFPGEVGGGKESVYPEGLLWSYERVWCIKESVSANWWIWGQGARTGRTGGGQNTGAFLVRPVLMKLTL